MKRFFQIRYLLLLSMFFLSLSQTCSASVIGDAFSAAKKICVSTFLSVAKSRDAQNLEEAEAFSRDFLRNREIVLEALRQGVGVDDTLLKNRPTVMLAKLDAYMELARSKTDLTLGQLFNKTPDQLSWRERVLKDKVMAYAKKMPWPHEVYPSNAELVFTNYYKLFAYYNLSLNPQVALSTKVKRALQVFLQVDLVGDLISYKEFSSLDVKKMMETTLLNGALERNIEKYADLGRPGDPRGRLRRARPKFVRFMSGLLKGGIIASVAYYDPILTPVSALVLLKGNLARWYTPSSPLLQEYLTRGWDGVAEDLRMDIGRRLAGVFLWNRARKVVARGAAFYAALVIGGSMHLPRFAVDFLGETPEHIAAVRVAKYEESGGSWSFRKDDFEADIRGRIAFYKADDLPYPTEAVIEKMWSTAVDAYFLDGGASKRYLPREGVRLEAVFEANRTEFAADEEFFKYYLHQFERTMILKDEAYYAEMVENARLALEAARESLENEPSIAK